MEIKKISFKDKDDVQKQWLFGEEHFQICNFDCEEWKLNSWADKEALGELSYCYEQVSAKSSIYL